MKGLSTMVEKMYSQFNTPEAMLNAMRLTLQEINPQHKQEQNAFEEGLRILRECLDDTQEGLLDAYIAEEERSMAEQLFHLFWKGVQQNYECFRNPVNAYFLKMDFEDFHQESLMTAFFPHKYEEAGRIFIFALPDELRVLTDPIIAYYSYLQTWAYKLAHYYGFVYANGFLKKIIPGYHANHCTTIIYRAMLNRYFSPDVKI